MFLVVVVLAVLACLLVVLGYEPVVRYALRAGLERAEMKGAFRVEGSVFSFLELADVSLEGSSEGVVRSVRCDLLRVDYGLPELLASGGRKGWHLLTVRGLAVSIDGDRLPPAPGASDEDGDGDEDGGPIEVEEYLSYLKYCGIVGEAIDVTYTTGGVGYEVKGLAVGWEVGAREGKLEAQRVVTPQVRLERPVVGVAVAPGWDAVELSGLQVREGLAVTRARWEHAATAVGWAASAELRVGEAELAVRFEPEQPAVRLALGGGELDLAVVRQVLELDEGELPEARVREMRLVLAGDPQRPATWAGELALAAGDVGIGPVRIEALRCDATFTDGVVNVGALDVSAGSAAISAAAVVDMREVRPADGFRWEALKGSGKLAVDAEDLGALVATAGAKDAPLLAGKFAADLEWAMGEGKLQRLSGPVRGRGLRIGAATLAAVDLACDSSHPDEVLVEGRIAVNPDTGVTVSGNYGIRTGDYRADVKADTGDLGGLRTSLGGADGPAAQSLGGRASAEVAVAGNALAADYRLSGRVAADAVRLGDAEPIALSAQFSHDPGATQLDDFTVATGELRLTMNALLAGGTLNVPSLTFASGGEERIAGRLQMPLDPARVTGAHPFLSQPGELTARLSIQPTSVADLYRIAGREASGVTGTLEGSLDAEGTLGNPVVNAALQFRQVGVASAGEKVAPADATLDFSVREHRLRVNGRVTQPEIEPVTLQGEVPFDPLQWSAPGATEALADSPVTLAIRMPPTALGKLPEWIPAIAIADGALDIDARVTGTLRKPLLAGEVHLDLPQLGFRRAALPDIRDAQCDLEFSGGEVVIRQLQGTVAGGRIVGSGSVGIGDLSNPVLHLNVEADEALFYRSEDLSVRSDLSLRLEGPVSAVSVTGDVALVNSRYQKEIDILPIAFPQRAPKIPSVGGPRRAHAVPAVSIAAKPFADWNFDIHATTGDPFLIIGNLATGKVHADLQLTGKGSDLKPAGEVRLEDAVATLPFSDLSVELATLTFLEASGFDPNLSADATAEVSDYQLRVHVYGTLSDPRYILTANPPLPEEDVLSLLVTGATREQLTSSGQGQGQMVAKGGKLLLEKLRQDMGLSSREQRLIPRNLTLDIGGVNQRTGEPAATAKLKLREQLFVLGDIDTEGQYRGILKWVIRFR